MFPQLMFTREPMEKTDDSIVPEPVDIKYTHTEFNCHCCSRFCYEVSRSFRLFDGELSLSKTPNPVSM